MCGVLETPTKNPQAPGTRDSNPLSPCGSSHTSLNLFVVPALLVMMMMMMGYLLRAAMSELFGSWQDFHVVTAHIRAGDDRAKPDTRRRRRRKFRLVITTGLVHAIPYGRFTCAARFRSHVRRASAFEPPLSCNYPHVTPVYLPYRISRFLGAVLFKVKFTSATYPFAHVAPSKNIKSSCRERQAAALSAAQRYRIPSQSWEKKRSSAEEQSLFSSFFPLHRSSTPSMEYGMYAVQCYYRVCGVCVCVLDVG
ncbi:unnamed protein product [Strongylus vulgaris]|uniref:Uncharacterized protein n=1 Tax=Strongylus vulgaris TaxID=40348 RepID=A0A3P7J6B2_STRVU|nr:unnamed protein product [Strongylus vulgaris]